MSTKSGVCNCHKSRKLAQGQFAVRQKKQGNHKEFENEIGVGTLILILSPGCLCRADGAPSETVRGGRHVPEDLRW